MLTALAAVSLPGMVFAQQSINIPTGAEFWNAAGNAENIPFTYSTTVASGFVVGNSVDYTAGSITEVQTSDFVSENRLRLRVDSAPTSFADVQFSSTTSYTGTFNFPAATGKLYFANSGFQGLVVPTNAVLTAECFNSGNDGAGADAILSTGITLTVNQFIPPSFDSGVLAGPFNSGGDLYSADNAVVNLGTVGASFIMGTSHLFSGVNTRVNTASLANEARVRIRNSAYPTYWTMEFKPTAGTYTAGTIALSSVTVTTPSVASGFSDLQHSTLRGLSMPAGSTFSAEFWDILDNGAGADSSWTNVQIAFNSGLAWGPTGSPTPATFVDMGTVTNANATTATALSAVTGALTAGQVSWFKVTIPGNVAGNAGKYFNLWTSTTGTTGAVTDTVVSIFDNSGRWLGYDDDSGLVNFSMMTFGAPGAVAPYSVTGVSQAAFNGKAAGGLTAGTYWIAVASWASGDSYGDGFSVASPYTGSFLNGVQLNVISNVEAPPANVDLTGSLNLSDTSATFAFNRNISYSVMQGTTVVASGTVVADASSESFSISVPASATGAATIEWDGSSFLLRKTNINLTGSAVAVGSVSVQNGDVDNSGEVDAADIDEVIADFGDTTDNPSDVDVSGEVDAADIDIVIANFGGVND